MAAEIGSKRKALLCSSKRARFAARTTFVIEKESPKGGAAEMTALQKDIPIAFLFAAAAAAAAAELLQM